MTAPFRRLRVAVGSGNVQRIDIERVAVVEFAGAIPEGTIAHFAEPGGDPHLSAALEILEHRVIPCELESSLWIEFPSGGSAALDPVLDVILWSSAQAVRAGGVRHTLASGILYRMHNGSRNQVIPTFPALAHEMHEQVNGTFARGTMIAPEARFSTWASAGDSFRVLLHALDFVGGFRQIAQFDSSALATGGHGLQLRDELPPLGWRLSAYSLAAAQSDFSYLVATVPA